MHQDATGYRGRSQPTGLCVRWEPIPLHKKGAEPSPPKKIGPCLLWPNGWMDQGGTWHEGTPQLGDFVLDGDPVPLPKKGTEPTPQFSAHFYCGQTAGCIKMPLGMEVGLSPGDFVLDGDSAPCPKTGRTPNFWPMSIVAKRLDG